MTIEALIAEWKAFRYAERKDEMQAEAPIIMDAVASCATEEEYPYDLLSCVSFIAGHRAAEKAGQAAEQAAESALERGQ